MKLSYEVYQKPEDPSEIYETIVRSDLVHATGYGLLATPADATNTAELQFSIHWEELPDEWITISSYGINRLLQFKATTTQLLHAIYAAGKLRVYQLGDDQTPVFLSLYWELDEKDEAISSSLKEIIHTQRSFFYDPAFPYYAISLVRGDNPYNWGGTALSNSFTAFLPKSVIRTQYYPFFAHEHLHTWIGGKIHNSDPEELNYWWSEGFTDYYSRVLGLRSRGISFEEFIAECNELLKNYYFSPVLNEPNARIKEDFWKDGDIERLPYSRGFVFAIYLNDFIKRSNRTSSLDDLMLELLAATEQQDFSLQLFESIARNHIATSVEAEISKCIDKGDTIDLKGVMDALPLERLAMSIYDLGFDERTLAEGRVIRDI